MFRRVALVSFLLGSVLASPALATPPLTTQGWQTGVMRKPDGEFVYCVSESRYQGGLWLVLALNPTGDINLGVGQQGVQLPVGQEKPVQLTVNPGGVYRQTAKAVKPELMVVNIGQNSGFLDALAAGQTLDIDGITFALTGSGNAIANLRECVYTSSSGNTSVSRAPAQPAPAASAPAAPPVAASQPPVAPAVNSQVAMPGDRDRVDLPPSMQQGALVVPAAQAPLPAPAVVAAVQPPVAVAPASPPPVVPDVAPAGVADQTPTQAVPPPVVQAALPANPAPATPEKYVLGQLPAEAPAPAAAPVSSATPPAPVAPTPAPVTAPTPTQVRWNGLPAASPISPVTRPLPAPLQALLVKARVRDITPAPVTDSTTAFAWASRDMNGTIRELLVPAGSSIEQLAGQYLSQLNAQCTARFSPNMGHVEATGALELLTASAVCVGSGVNDYTTMVFALNGQGVLSIVSHQIDKGRRAAPDRAQKGVLEALKAQ